MLMKVAAQISSPITINGCRPTRSDTRPMIGLDKNEVTACTLNNKPTSPGLSPTERPYSGRNAIKAPLAIIFAASVELVINTRRLRATARKPLPISARTGARPFSRTRGGGSSRWRLKKIRMAMQPNTPAVTNAAENPAVIRQPAPKKGSKKRAGLGTGRIGSHGRPPPFFVQISHRR